MTGRALPDIQDSFDDRGIDLDEVGISGLRYPTTFDDGHTQQSGIADMDLTVALPARRRGTHMSRMVELVDEHLTTLRPQDLPVFVKTCGARLEAETVRFRVALPFATRVRAPETAAESAQVHELVLTASHSDSDDDVHTTVTSELMSLCPCSKAISDYGAHNQRSQVTLTIQGEGDDPYPLPVADAVEIIRAAGSSPVYPVVKRPDERAITMTAFDNPKFVEDIARDISLACRSRGLSHRVYVRNLESIHSHDAVAVVDCLDR